MNTRNQIFTLAPLFAMALCNAAFAGSITNPRTFAGGGLITGNFTMTQMSDSLGSNDNLSVFDAVRGHSIQFAISFDAIGHEVYATEAGGGRRRILTTTPARVSFFGDQTGYLQHVVSPTLHCAVQIEIDEDAVGNTFFDRFSICEAVALEYFGFGCGPADLSVTGRSPGVQAVGLDSETMAMQRFGTAPAMKDRATGPAHFAIIDVVPVAVELRAFGEIKALYR